MNHKFKKFVPLTAVGMLLFLSACGQKNDTNSPEQTPTAVPTIAATSTPAATNTPVPTEAVENPVAEPTTVPEVPTDSPTSTPEPTATSAPTAAPTPALTKDDFNGADFLTDAVFAGDSVMSHFYWKVPVYDKENFGESDFLVAVSYSAREALKEVSDIHPMYKGEQRPIWESMKLIEPKRVFLFFGLNDIGISGVEGFAENYKTLIGNVREAVPEAKLYVISTTPMRADCEGKNLNNANITAANGLMQTYCAENNIGYIDVASLLMDDTGALNTEYSDGTNVHLTTPAYEMWRDALLDYGKEVLLNEYYENAD
ncbi:MAG: hypothetical protein J6J42_08530 [Lachnospiraceae bacterium]|nr:hypothetical protein [Lachnospiraceae bacterium]